MGDNKISEAAVEVAAFAVPASVPTLEDAKKVVRRVVKLYLRHSQPAELSEVSGGSVEVSVPKGWRVTPHTDPWRSGDRWEVYGPNGGGGVNEHDIQCCSVRGLLDALAATGKQQVGEVHPDDAAVDAFAGAMKAKMADARAKGRGGWEDPAQCTAEDLSRMLRDHVEKGDPRDVANFCMMLHHRGEAIAAQVGEVQGDARAQFEAWWKRENYNRGALNSWHGSGYNNVGVNAAWASWQSALAARKVEELAAQGYVTNGVAIFNPETGKRGLVDNLGYVGWQGAQGIDLGPLRDLLSRWDDLAERGVVPSPNQMQKCARQVRDLIDGRDAGTGVR